MIKMTVDGKKEYCGIEKIVKRLIRDIGEGLKGYIYCFYGLENASEEEISTLDDNFAEVLSEFGDEIYYSYDLDFFQYEDNKKYTFFDKEFLSVDDAIEKIDEKIAALIILKNYLHSNK